VRFVPAFGLATDILFPPVLFIVFLHLLRCRLTSRAAHYLMRLRPRPHLMAAGLITCNVACPYRRHILSGAGEGYWDRPYFLLVFRCGSLMLGMVTSSRRAALPTFARRVVAEV